MNMRYFSFNEKMTWAKMLEEEYSKLDKENKLSGLNNQPSFDKFWSNEKIDTNKKVAEDIGLGSKETYRQVKYIYNNAPEELIQQLDNEQLSINKAYITLREQLKSEKEKANQLEQQLKQEQSKPPKVIEKEIDNTDYHKIDELQDKIKKYDNES